MITPENDTSHAKITQEELEAFMAFSEYLSVLKRPFERDRKRLIHLAKADAPVEPGRFQVSVEESEQRRITRAFLITLFGPDDFESMRSEVPPTEHRRLVIEEQPRRWASFMKGGGPTSS